MGEESQIESTIAEGDVAHELARALSAIPNPAIATTLEMAESVEKKISV
jgi:hypothetical protein